MLSILIPIYNYNSYPLVQELHKQSLECNINFEILCQDDASNQYLNENQKINSVGNCTFFRNNSNLGRGKNINSLAEKAKFKWLLIMDCDTHPTKNNYIQNYISEIKDAEKVVFGGIEYQKEKPANDQLLRWFYGIARESLSVEKRNTNPNGNALTSNILINKNLFLTNKFDEAITSYETFIAAKGDKIVEEDVAFIEDSKLGIQNCNNGKELISKKVIADIQNISSPINTAETEGVPVISADESIMIYTYIGTKSTGGLLNDFLKPDKEEGTYHEDIFISTRGNDSTWNAPVGISSLNSDANDAAVALSPDGQILFTFVSDVKNPGDLYMSTYNGAEWSKAEKLNSNVNSEYWEGSCSITSDGRYLYFASERTGGLGGRDLYVSEKVNGDWSVAVNLGPSINTKYNEDFPHLSDDNVTLYFASQGHNSIGGFDIFKSQFDSVSGKW